MTTRSMVYVSSSLICIAMHGAVSAQETGAEPQGEIVEVGTSTTAIGDESTDAIVVTGSRLSAGAASEPVTVITAEEITARGITSIDELLRQVSNNTPAISASNTGAINGRAPLNRSSVVSNLEGGSVVDLRGLGAGSTLVLLNGRRLAGEGVANADFADISAIPIETIERIEIVSAGASAIYGADAVAGVINIIQKSDYTGLSLSGQYGFSESGGDELRLGGTLGVSWGSGNINLSGSYLEQDTITANGFGVTTRDFRDLGGTDRRTLTSTRGVFLATSGALPFLPASDVFSSSGLLLPVDSGPVGAGTDPSTFDVVARDDLSEFLPVNLAPGFETWGVSFRASQDIPLGIINNIQLDASYSQRDTMTEVEAPRIDVAGFIASFNGFGSPFPSGSPFPFPFRTDVDFSLDLTEVVNAGILANEFIDTQSENFDIGGRITGDLSKNWGWEASASFSRNEDRGIFDELVLGDLLTGRFDFDTFTFTPPVNLQRADFLVNDQIAQTLQNARRVQLNDGQTDLLTFQGFVRGKLFTGRASGPLEVVIGGEYREESLNFIRTSTDTLGIEVTQPDLDSNRETTAFFAELSFPIHSSVVVNAALRYEDIQNNGTSVTRQSALDLFRENGINQFTPVGELAEYSGSSDGFSPRLGIALYPTDDLTIRATIGRSFRAPNATEIGQASIVASPFDPQVDPVSGVVLDPTLVPLVSGGNPDLGNETAETLNVGGTYRFDALGSNFRVDVDYFAIDYSNRISSSAPFLGASFPQRDLSEPAIVRDAAGNPEFLFSGPVNLASQFTAGLDVKFNHVVSLGELQIDSLFTYSRILDNEERLTEGSPFESTRGEDQPSTRWNFRSQLTYNNWSLTGVVIHNGGYSVESVGFIDGVLTMGQIPVDSLTLVDLNLAYTLPKSLGPIGGTRVTLAVDNVFDQDPPFLNLANGFSSLGYDLRRRTVFVGLRKSF